MKLVPKHLQIHHADLPPDEFELMNGIQVTTPAQSVLDCFSANLSSALIQ